MAYEKLTSVYPVAAFPTPCAVFSFG